MKTVLLIEPDADSARSYAATLERAGFNVEIMTGDDNGKQGVAPDLVVISVPRVDRSLVRIFAQGRSIPRIALSSEASDATRAADFDCAGILIRPVMYDDLVTLVRRVLKEIAAVQAV
jgi:DNA-binding response OmpR family regulator